MQVLVTGSSGFIGKNLLEKLSSLEDITILTFTRFDTLEILRDKIKKADFIFHLAGVNRPKNLEEFYKGNRDLTKLIVDEVIKNNKKIPILITSSTQVEKDNDYGKSKFYAEEILKEYKMKMNTSIYIYRLTNVFGKWCRPNYNSVIGTWCYNIVNNLPIKMNDESVMLNLVYIDDVVKIFIKHLGKEHIFKNYYEVTPLYQKSLGQIYKLLFHFKEKNIVFDKLENFEKKLYLTYKNYEKEKDVLDGKF